MALYREQPTCIYCGEEIQSIHNNMGKHFVGDTFLHWDYSGHNKTCKHHPLNKNILNNQNKISMKQTLIEMSVDSTKQSPSHNVGNPTQHEIQCNVPYGQDNVFYRMSGGTTLTLLTVNDEAASLFKAGKKVRLTIEAID